MKKDIEIYTDGACCGNPGPGGWGVLVIKDGLHYEYGGYEEDTTNNIMELTAAIEALLVVENEQGPIKIYTDSQYLKKGITQWVHIWKTNGWKTSSGDEVKNIDLWQELDELNRVEIRWEWVKGHDDNPYNCRVDNIARAFAKGEEIKLLMGEKPEGKEECVDTPLCQDTSLNKTSEEAIPEKSAKEKKTAYLCLIDGEVKRFTTWDECKIQVEGKSGAKYKKIKSKKEEAETLKEWGIEPVKQIQLQKCDTAEKKTEEGSLITFIPYGAIDDISAKLKKSGFAEEKKAGNRKNFRLSGIKIEICENGRVEVSSENLKKAQITAASLETDIDSFFEDCGLPGVFDNDVSKWESEEIYSFIRPFLKGMVGRWKFTIENDVIKIEDPENSGSYFEAHAGESYSWKVLPPDRLYGRIVESAKKSQVFEDRFIFTALPDRKDQLRAVIFPLGKDNVILSGSYDWTDISGAFDTLSGYELYNLAKTIGKQSKKMHIISEQGDIGAEGFKRALLNACEFISEVSKDVPGLLSRYPADIIISRELLEKYSGINNSDIDNKKLIIRKPAGHFESNALKMAEFFLDVLHNQEFFGS